MSELKNCPFCGCNNIDIIKNADWYQGKCNICGMRGPLCWYESDVMKSWNSMVRKEDMTIKIGKKYRVAVSGFQEVEAEDSNLAIEKVVQENSLNIESIRVFGVID